MMIEEEKKNRVKCLYNNFLYLYLFLILIDTLIDIAFFLNKIKSDKPDNNQLSNYQ